MAGFRSRARGSSDNSSSRGQQEGRGGRSGRSAAQRGAPRRGQEPNRSTPAQRQRAYEDRKPRVTLGVDVARSCAFEAILKVMRDDAFSNLVLPRLLRERQVKGRDAAFATELTYGTLRTAGVLDCVIGECSSRAPQALDREILAALRLGAYQLLYTRVEQHAAVDTTVRLVKSLNPKVSGFANAVMREMTRPPKAGWLQALAPRDDVAAAAFQSAHPLWIAESFARALGSAADEELTAALRADSQRPITHLVARPGEISAAELAAVSGGEEGAYSPYAVYLTEHGNPADLEPIQHGLAAVQDEGSQLIARGLTLAPVTGDDSGRWLDLCAGPGGKTALLAALSIGADTTAPVTVDAVEMAEHRAELVRKTVRDLPVRVKVADGRDPGLTPGYDRILVDAPCSGLGALRRRAEARWRKSEEDIAELSQLQYELVASAVALARSGGVIAYSTCSPDLRETRDVVDRAVRELAVEEISAHEFVAPLADAGEHLSVQMWPHRHGTDAMFFAVLRKK